MSEMRQRMLRGELYLADDPEIQGEQARARELAERYNATATTSTTRARDCSASCSPTWGRGWS